MTYDELKQAQAAGAHIYGIEADGKLHRIENPGWSCPPDRYIALLPFDSDLVRDAAQLDWLVSNEFDLVTRREDIGEDEYAIWWFVVDSRKSTARHLHTVSGHPLGSPREAIDAAIHAQAGGSES